MSKITNAEIHIFQGDPNRGGSHEEYVLLDGEAPWMWAVRAGDLYHKCPDWYRQRVTAAGDAAEYLDELEAGAHLLEELQGEEEACQEVFDTAERDAGLLGAAWVSAEDEADAEYEARVENLFKLLRLLSMLALWPTAEGRKEFVTDLHLKRAIEEAHEDLYGR